MKALLAFVLACGWAPQGNAILVQERWKKASRHNITAAGRAGSNSSGSLAVPFSTTSYKPAVGKAFALYYSSYSGEKVTSVEARAYRSLNATSSSADVFEPESGALLSKGACPLTIVSQTNYPSDHHKAALRLAELAVCEVMVETPCKEGDSHCEVEVLAPLPYSNDQEPYLAATLALVVNSFLCAEQRSDMEAPACTLQRRSDTAIAAGLQIVDGAVVLKPLPNAWVELKLDACYELGFKRAILAVDNEGAYEETPYYSPDVLAFQHTPPEAVFCRDLPCLENAMLSSP